MAAAASSSPPLSAPRWSSDQDKQFEKALASWDDENSTKWEDLSALIPGKTAAEVKKHFELLVQDVKSIDAGLVPLPVYTPRDALVKEQQQHQQSSLASPTPDSSKKSGLPSSSSSLYHHQHHHHANGSQNPSSSSAAANASNNSGSSSKSKAQDQERRKGIPWTEDEHKLFLLGLEKFGKGDWRSISRNFVVSRTPTQVASHAQKYFIRLNSIHKDKRRTSIHDITSVNGDGRQQSTPITGQGGVATTPGAGGAPGSSSGGAAVGQPAPYPQPAVGTPVNLPQPVHHAGFAPGRSHVSGRPVPGTPLMAYPMPQPAMHH